MLRPILSNERVRLMRELPELGMDAGAVGVVRNAWFYPTTAYEVEFPAGPSRGGRNRLLLLEDEVAPITVEARGVSDHYVAAFNG
jgi:hypothetical protein